ncbi:hypothetical protein M378DRAFT_14833 [Amanita muscaria Koide BX008]|uniref:Uncharacterized protein n=1 Tax=Amanita muscaria (strain Koide BX008) TaxID=946122 RepID=A0A0C2WDG4_AMAMK|nr:hypothetical protein M378DRAFT_14833 [Amanita muscaria Koide BX008]
MTTNKPRAANSEVAERLENSRAETISTALDLSVFVLKTLQYVAHISPVPFLFNAATIALSIAEEKTQSNKCGFKELAKDSCNIVYEIINSQKDVSTLEGVAVDLEKNLVQLVNVLRSIEDFARKGASRHPLLAVFRSSADARRIQGYKDKLNQAIHVFGLQSDIAIRKNVAQMGEQLNSISRAVAPCSPHRSLLNILRRTPQNDTSVVNFEALFHLENILSTDVRVMLKEMTDIQDKKNLIAFVNQVRRAKLLVWSRVKDGEGRAHLLVKLTRRTIKTRITYQHIKGSVSHLFKRPKKRSEK